MITINIFPWKIYCDNIATLQAYNQIEKGDTERCGCVHCLNFLKVREQVYPEKAKILFCKLGIDYKKEQEVYYLNKTKTGWHYYGGWFHFIGTVEKVEENRHPHDPRLMELVEVDENFSWSFSNSGDSSCHKVFKNQSIGQVDFYVKVPWVIDAEDPK